MEEHWNRTAETWVVPPARPWNFWVTFDKSCPRSVPQFPQSVKYGYGHWPPVKRLKARDKESWGLLEL